MVIVNKSDLPQQVDLAQLRERFGADKVMTLSAKTLVGIEAFTAWLKSYVYGSKGTLEDGAYIQNARQERLLREALAGLQDAEAAAQDYLPYDCIVIDVRSAIDLLGRLRVIRCRMRLSMRFLRGSVSVSRGSDATLPSAR